MQYLLLFHCNNGCTNALVLLTFYRMEDWETTRSFLYRQNTITIMQIRGAPQNSRCQRGDMKKISYRGPTNIRCHRTKFSRLSDVAPGIYAPLVVYPKLSGFRIPDRSFFKGFQAILYSFYLGVYISEVCRTYHCLRV